MSQLKRISVFFILVAIVFNYAGAKESKSVYTLKFNDPEAFYFTTENYSIKVDGKFDVSDELQKAINEVKTEKNFGILFIPEENIKSAKPFLSPKPSV